MEVSSQCPHCTNDHCIRSVPLFASLEPDAVHALTAQMEHKHISKRGKYW
jgi:CRP/FNR family transcriptional regulator